MRSEREPQENFGPDNSITRQLVETREANMVLEDNILNHEDMDFDNAYTYTMDMVANYRKISYLNKMLAELNNDWDEVAKCDRFIRKYSQVTDEAEDGNMEPAASYLRSKANSIVKHFGKIEYPEKLLRYDSLAKGYMKMSETLLDENSSEDNNSL